MCWNRQTRWTQNPLPAMACGFKSRHRHHLDHLSQSEPIGFGQRQVILFYVLFYASWKCFRLLIHSGHQKLNSSKLKSKSLKGCNPNPFVRYRNSYISHYHQKKRRDLLDRCVICASRGILPLSFPEFCIRFWRVVAFRCKGAYNYQLPFSEGISTENWQTLSDLLGYIDEKSRPDPACRKNKT